jgi:hypothetical protein
LQQIEDLHIESTQASLRNHGGKPEQQSPETLVSLTLRRKRNNQDLQGKTTWVSHSIETGHIYGCPENGRSSEKRREGREDLPVGHGVRELRAEEELETETERGRRAASCVWSFQKILGFLLLRRRA